MSPRAIITLLLVLFSLSSTHAQNAPAQYLGFREGEELSDIKNRISKDRWIDAGLDLKEGTRSAIITDYMYKGKRYPSVNLRFKSEKLWYIMHSTDNMNGDASIELLNAFERTNPKAKRLTTPDNLPCSVIMYEGGGSFGLYVMASQKPGFNYFGMYKFQWSGYLLSQSGPREFHGFIRGMSQEACQKTIKKELWHDQGWTAKTKAYTVNVDVEDTAGRKIDSLSISLGFDDAPGHPLKTVFLFHAEATGEEVKKRIEQFRATHRGADESRNDDGLPQLTILYEDGVATTISITKSTESTHLYFINEGIIWW